MEVGMMAAYLAAQKRLAEKEEALLGARYKLERETWDLTDKVERAERDYESALRSYEALASAITEHASA